jgi:uncharacterized metal-binding protein YceD (DUF177 family)
MKLEVKNLVFAALGKSDSFNIELFNEKIDEEVMAERLKGTLKLTKLDEQILAAFDFSAKIKLVCDRCLSEYEVEIPLKFKQEYLLERPQEETGELYVDREFKIDVLEPLRQETLIHLPTKKICSEKCEGIKN